MEELGIVKHKRDALGLAILDASVAVAFVAVVLTVAKILAGDIEAAAVSLIIAVMQVFYISVALKP